MGLLTSPSPVAILDWAPDCIHCPRSREWSEVSANFEPRHLGTHHHPVSLSMSSSLSLLLQSAYSYGQSLLTLFSKPHSPHLAATLELPAASWPPATLRCREDPEEATIGEERISLDTARKHCGSRKEALCLRVGCSQGPDSPLRPQNQAPFLLSARGWLLVQSGKVPDSFHTGAIHVQCFRDAPKSLGHNNLLHTCLCSSSPGHLLDHQ